MRAPIHTEVNPADNTITLINPITGTITINDVETYPYLRALVIDCLVEDDSIEELK